LLRLPHRDREHIGQHAQAKFDPLPSMLERLGGLAIITTQKSATHAAGDVSQRPFRPERSELCRSVPSLRPELLGTAVLGAACAAPNTVGQRLTRKRQAS
jgi:hypothetical protein